MRLARLGVNVAFVSLATLTIGCEIRMPEPPRAVDVPFTDDGRVVVKARVGARHTLNIILDTGGPSLDLALFDPSLGDSLGLDYVGEAESGTGTARVARGVRVKIGNLAFVPESVIVMDERRPNFPTQDGVIGRLVFERSVVEFDFENSVVRFHEPGGFRPGPDWRELPLQLVGGVPVIECGVNGDGSGEVSRLLFIDLGSREPLMLYADEHRGIRAPGGAPEEFVGSGAQGNVYGRRGSVLELRVGRFKLNAIGAWFVPPDTPVEIGPPGIDGVMGGDLLREFDLAFDYGNETVYVRKAGSGEEVRTAGGAPESGSAGE
jgi:hypothetical protein